MKEELQIFFPNRRPFIKLLFMLGALIAMNVTAIYKYESVVFLISMVFLIAIFLFVFYPVIRNQKLLISGADLRIMVFGRIHKLNFTKNLCEVVEREGELVSYRFESEGKHFQVSPQSYYESDEIQRIFKTLLKKNKLTVSVVEK